MWNKCIDEAHLFCNDGYFSHHLPACQCDLRKKNRCKHYAEQKGVFCTFMKKNQTEFMKLCLADALIKLMLDQDFSSININTICEEAGIGRTTFYRHFDKKANKEDLLKYKLNYEWKTYKDFHPEEMAGNKDGLLFRFIYDNRDLFSLFYRRGLITTIMSIVEDFMFEKQTYGRDYAYIMSYMTYGCFGIIYQWIKYEFDESPEQVFGHIQDAITSAAQKK